MKTIVDGKTYKSKAKALAEFEEAIACTDGSEQERMTFAYFAIKEGANRINTYKETAVKET